jgi:hypothetical protein
MSHAITALTLVVVASFATSSATPPSAQEPACKPALVHCNYAHLYSGTIRIVTVDSVASPDHIVRNESDVLITLAGGTASCRGQHRDHEKMGYRGRWDSETKGTGSSAGAGMLAVEFETQEGRLMYVLTGVCPTARMVKTSVALSSGTQQTDTVAPHPAAWNNASQLFDPQPATMIAMKALSGTQTLTRAEPENNAGGYTRVTWDLKRP